jgi:hypothetical protein
MGGFDVYMNYVKSEKIMIYVLHMALNLAFRLCSSFLSSRKTRFVHFKPILWFITKE